MSIQATVGDSDSDEYDEEDIYFTRRDGGFYPVRGKPGMFYKVFENEISLTMVRNLKLCLFLFYMLVYLIEIQQQSS